MLLPLLDYRALLLSALRFLFHRISSISFGRFGPLNLGRFFFRSVSGGSLSERCTSAYSLVLERLLDGDKSTGAIIRAALLALDVDVGTDSPFALFANV